MTRTEFIKEHGQETYNDLIDKMDMAITMTTKLFEFNDPWEALDELKKLAEEEENDRMLTAISLYREHITQTTYN